MSWMGGGGGGSPAATSQTVTTSNIAPWAQAGVTQLTQAGIQDVFPQYNQSTGVMGPQSGYTPFNANTAQQVDANGQPVNQGMTNAYNAAQSTTAGFTPLQQQSYQAAGNMQAPGQYNAATGLNQIAGMGSLGTTQGANLYGQMGAQAGASYGQNAQNPNAVASYMNPYLQNTLAPSMQLLNQQYGMQQAANQGAATQAGAFGGSRGTLQNSLNQQNQMLAQNQLVSNAYNQAYNTANTNMQNAASLGIQGAQAGLAGIGAQQAGYNAAGAAGTNLANIGTQQLGAQQSIAGLQNAYGAQQQQQQQNLLNTANQNYSTMQAYPIQQLQQLEGLYTGAPTTTSTANYQAAPSTLSQVAGLGMAGYGLSQLGGSSSTTATGKKAGGVIKEGGIDRLPAKNLERFDEGGITGQGPTPYESGKFTAADTSMGMPDPRYQGLGIIDAAKLAGSDISDWMSSAEKNAVAAQAARVAPPQPAPQAPQAAPAPQQNPAVTTVPNPMNQGLGATQPTAQPTAQPAPAMPQAPRVGGGPAPTAASAANAANDFIHYKELASGIQDYQRQNDARTDAYLKAREEGKPTTPAMIEYEARLKAQEAKAANEEHDAKGLAFLTSGLAVLGGASPYAGVNLGQATKGVEQYRDAMKDIKRSAEERDKAFAMIEQARHADARGDWEEKNKALDNAFSSKQKAAEFGITALTNLGIKSGETAAGLYSSLNKDWTSRQIADATNATTLQHAGITANAPIALMNALGSAQPGSPLLKGFEMQKQEAMIPHLYQSYMTTIADPMKGPEFKAMYPTFEAYMAGLPQAGGNGSSGFVQPPANATILKPKQ